METMGCFIPVWVWIQNKLPEHVTVRICFIYMSNSKPPYLTGRYKHASLLHTVYSLSFFSKEKTFIQYSFTIEVFTQTCLVLSRQGQIKDPRSLTVYKQFEKNSWRFSVFQTNRWLCRPLFILGCRVVGWKCQKTAFSCSHSPWH